jgi:MFS family permease
MKRAKDDFAIIPQMKPRTKSHAIYTIAVIGFIYTLHIVVPMYSNSSFLNVFVNEKIVGYIYMVGAAVTILGFLIAPTWIRKLGNYRTAITLICIQIALFFGIINATETSTIIILFILQSAVISMIGLSLDIFLEAYTDGIHAGAIRGMYSATLNASWVIGPLIGSMIINGSNNYHNTYVAALAMLFPLLYLIHRNFPRFKDPHYTHPSLWQLVKHIDSNRSWSRLFVVNIILQVFYAWMTIYCPIYLHETLGLGWESIGIILVIMLIPFPLIQYPLGKLADKKYGEKSMMIAGFTIMGVSTIMLAAIGTPSIILWSIGLFVTRIGAAMSEIMLETYFFKTFSMRDTATLGMFRLTRPLSNFIAPIISMTGLLFVTDKYMFVIIGIISLAALYPIWGIKDIVAKVK